MRPETPPRSAALGRMASLVVASLLLWLPRASLACAVCMNGRDDESRVAFIITTAFMTFMPLLLLFFSIRWFIRRTLERERQDEAARVLGALRR